jgi:hypothetical protein
MPPRLTTKRLSVPVTRPTMTFHGPPLSVSLVDGSLPAFSWDSAGDVASVTATGKDGVIHRLNVTRSSDTKVIGSGPRARPVPAIATVQYEFFENSNRFFSMAASLTLGGNVFAADISAWTDSRVSGLPLTYASYDLRFSEDLIKVKWWQDQKVMESTREMGIDAVPVDALATASTSDGYPRISSLFGDEIKRVAYFEPVLTTFADQVEADGREALQDLAGRVSLNDIVTTIRPMAASAAPQAGQVGVMQQALSSKSKRELWKGLLWGVAGGAAAFVCATAGAPLCVIGGVLWGFDASVYSGFVDDAFAPPPQPPGGGGGDGGVAPPGGQTGDSPPPAPLPKREKTDPPL